MREEGLYNCGSYRTSHGSCVENHFVGIEKGDNVVEMREREMRIARAETKRNSEAFSLHNATFKVERRVL